MKMVLIEASIYIRTRLLLTRKLLKKCVYFILHTFTKTEQTNREADKKKINLKKKTYTKVLIKID